MLSGEYQSNMCFTVRLTSLASPSLSSIVSLSCLSLYSQVQEAKVNEVKINEAREHYRPVAVRASLLYFIMNDLNKINPMYQFSLKVMGLERVENSDSLDYRV